MGSPTPPKRVLLITNSEHGQANVFLATSYALLTLPDEDVQVHFASFPSIQKSVLATSDHALRDSPQARPLVFHEVAGLSMVDAWSRPEVASERQRLAIVDVVSLFYAIRRMMVLLKVMLPWTGPEFVEIMKSVMDIVEDVRPDVIAVDPAFSPALTALRYTGTKFMVLSPNTIKDFVMPLQPNGEALWKYPWCVSHPSLATKLTPGQHQHRRPLPVPRSPSPNPLQHPPRNPRPHLRRLVRLPPELRPSPRRPAPPRRAAHDPQRPLPEAPRPPLPRRQPPRDRIPPLRPHPTKHHPVVRPPLPLPHHPRLTPLPPKRPHPPPLPPPLPLLPPPLHIPPNRPNNLHQPRHARLLRRARRRRNGHGASHPLRRRHLRQEEPASPLETPAPRTLRPLAAARPPRAGTGARPRQDRRVARGRADGGAGHGAGGLCGASRGGEFVFGGG